MTLIHLLELNSTAVGACRYRLTLNTPSDKPRQTKTQTPFNKPTRPQTSLGSPLTLLGPVTFTGDVTVTDDVTTNQLNGERPEQWLGSLVLQGDTEVTLGGPLRIQQAAVAGHVLAPGEK